MCMCVEDSRYSAVAAVAAVAAAAAAAGQGGPVFACPPLYFCVLHDNSKTALFNISCQKEHLISAIRRSCRLDKDVAIELVTSGGQLLRLQEMKDNETMADRIHSRGVAILCKLEASKHPSIEPRLVPLISNPQAFPELVALVDSVEQRVAEREGKLSQKQLAEVKRLQQQQQQQQQLRQQHQLEMRSGMMRSSRYADKKIVLYNKVKPRP